MKTSKAVRGYHALVALRDLEQKQPTGILPFPGEIRLKLKHLFREEAKYYADYDATRLDLVRRFGKEGADGEIRVTAENMKEFFRELAAAGDVDCPIEFTPLAESAFDCVPFGLCAELAAAGIVAD